MEGELGSLLQSVLSDPDQMAQITQLAQGLMGGSAPGETPGAPEPAPSEGKASGSDPGLLSALGKAFSRPGGEKQSRSTALLLAMRPYMRPEKQEKLDRALKMAQMVRVAGAVLREFGGG